MENKTDSIAVCSLIKSYFYDPTPEELAQSCIDKATPGDKYYGLSKEQIINNWNQRKNEGIQLHKNIELNFEKTCICSYVNGILSRNYEKHDEMPLHLQTNKYLIKGRADCVFINHTIRRIIISEWKNCKFYYLKSNVKGYGPCSNLSNTKFTKHILQAEFYKRLCKSMFPDYEIITEVIYIYGNKIEKIIRPYELIINSVELIINDLNK